MVKRFLRPTFVFAIIILAAGIFVGTAHAATNDTWMATTTQNWNTSSSWSLGTVPTAANIAIFSASGTAKATINGVVNVAGIQMNAGYTGTITQSTGDGITVGSSNFTVASGTFVGSVSASDAITVNGSFSQTGGVVTSTAGIMTIGNGYNLTLSGGTFHGNGGVVQIVGSSTISCSGSPFNRVMFNITSGATEPVIGSGCTIPLGTNPTSSFDGSPDQLINNGTITASGTWTISMTNGGWAGDPIVNNGTIDVGGISVTSYLGDFQNYGSINVTSTWSGGGLVNESAGASFKFGGSALTIGDDYETSIGTAPTGITLTVNSESNVNPTIGCTSSQFSQVIFNEQSNTNGVTILAGCTIPLGANPSSTFDNGTYQISNSGTITASGTWTIYMTNGGYAGNPIINYGTIDIGGVNVATYLGDFQNWGTLNVSSSWNGSGEINETSTAVFYYGASSMTIGDDLEIQSGTAPTALTVTIDTESNVFANIGCTGSQLSQVFINEQSNTNYFTILHGCTVPLGTSPSSTFDNGDGAVLVNNGTITASGTWTMYMNNTGYDTDPIVNYGTINVGGISAATSLGDFWNYGHLNVTSTWSGSGLINATSGVFTFPGGSATVADDFEIVSGTATFTNGINLAFANTFTGTFYFAPGTTTYSGLTFDESGSNTLTFMASTPTSTLVTGNVYFESGNVTLPSAAYQLTVQGNYSQSSANTFGSASTTLDFTGTATSTLSMTAGTFSANLMVAKTGAAAVDLASAFTVTSQPCTVQTGTFNLENYNFTCGGAFTVNSGGWLGDYFNVVQNPSSLKLGSTMTNNGMVFIDGSYGALSCLTTVTSTNISIISTASGTQRSWSGSGTFIMRFVSVQDQSSTVPINVLNGTNLGDNGTNWHFNTGAVPELVQSTSTTGAVTSKTMTTAYWPKAGDLIVVTTAAQGQTISSPTDSAGNTYKLAESLSFTTSTGTYYLSVYYAANAVSTSTFTVTVNGGSGGVLSGGVFEFTGVIASTTLDNAVANTSAAGVTALTTTNATGNSSNEIYFGAMTFAAGTTASGAGGWNQDAQVGTTNGSSQALYGEDQEVTSTQTTAATWTSVATTSYGAIEAIFATQSGGTGGGTNYVASGTVYSATFDTGVTAGAQFNSVLWQGTLPPAINDSVGIQLAVATSSAGPWNYIGPDGTGASFFTAGPGVPISLVGNVGVANRFSLFNGNRYFRYAVTLFADNTDVYSPIVNKVVVNWSP